jgi:PucR family transcriptional regulator, purine catabolism regulatory protein
MNKTPPPLTIRKALQMPVLASAHVVAGETGLDNEITWVHIVDIPDARFEWARRGVLLLTAGYGLRDSAERQAALIPTLVKQGFAGMVLSVGYYFEETPLVMRQAADAASFPIIEVPRELLFINVTEALLEQIVNHQYGLLQQATHIHEQLTLLVLQGGNLDQLAETLAGLLERSITIEDTAFRVLAAAQYGRVDEARRRSIRHNRTTPEVAQRLLDKGIYDQLLQTMGPLRVTPMADLGMEMERFVAPIIVNREIHGYIWIIAGDSPLTDLDELAIGHAATVAALIFFHQQTLRETEEAMRGDFLTQLLRQGPEDTAVFSEQARRLQFRPQQPHQVLLIKGFPQAGGSSQILFHEIEDWLRRHEEFALLVRRDSMLVLVIESDENQRGKRVAKALVDALGHPAFPLFVSVGNVHPAQNGRNNVRQSYEEAQEVMTIAYRLKQQEGVMAFADLGLLHWLHQLAPEVREGNAYLGTIQILVDYDVRRSIDLVNTLEAYLDHGGSLVDTAEFLYIHRNTLLHRLERIEQLTQLDLRDPWQRLNLHAAIKSYRLQQG